MSYEYKVGDLVITTRVLSIAPQSYQEVLDKYDYPIGTLFKIIILNASANKELHGLRLIHNGEEVRQTGRDDGCTLSIHESYYELYKNKNKNRMILAAIKNKTYAVFT